MKPAIKVLKYLKNSSKLDLFLPATTTTNELDYLLINSTPERFTASPPIQPPYIQADFDQDSTTRIQIAHNPIDHKQTKHIEVN